MKLCKDCIYCKLDPFPTKGGEDFNECLRLTKRNRSTGEIIVDRNWCEIERSWLVVIIKVITLGLVSTGCGPLAFRFKSKKS